MITQSCIIGIKFSQEDFEYDNYSRLSCYMKFFNNLLLTFGGVFLLVPLEILDSLHKILTLPGLILGCGVGGVQFVDRCFERIKICMTGLNKYQLDSLDQQKKVTMLVFENAPFSIMLFSIKLGFLNCPELIVGKSATAVNISLGLTLFSVI